MKFIYPAVFRKEENGSYTGYFPDLSGCTARGDSLEEAVDDAHEAAEAWLSIELAEGQPLPPISDISDLPKEAGGEIRNICVNLRFHTGWDE